MKLKVTQTYFDRKEDKYVEKSKDGQYIELNDRLKMVHRSTQSRSYIDRIQATMPGLTSKKTASIRMQLKLM